MRYKVEYTQEDLDNILRLFYRTELRPGEKVIDNRDETIAKETGIHLPTVQRLISEHLIKKRIKLDKRINEIECQ